MNKPARNLARPGAYRTLAPKQIDYEFFDRARALRSVLQTETPLIFDVGANIGQSVTWFKEHWPRSVIHSFEPQAAEFARLLQVATLHRDVVANNTALGDDPGRQQTMTRHDLYPAASSLLTINPRSEAIKNRIHPKAHFEAGRFSNERVTIDTVDHYVGTNAIPHIDLIKIDVQGYEPEVLRGARKTLARGTVTAILTEIMFDDVYERVPSFYAVEAEIRDFGFRLYDICHIYKDLKRGRTHWVDALYVRSI